MSFWESQIFIIIIILLSIAVIIILTSLYECNSLKINHFSIINHKNANQLKAIFISDFHDKTNNSFTDNVIKSICNEDADILIIGGDLIDFSAFNSLINKVKYINAIDFIDKLATNFYKKPGLNNYNGKRIFFSYGNHELRLKSNLTNDKYKSAYNRLLDVFNRHNVCLLDDNTIRLGDGFTLSGISLFDGYYVKEFSKANVKRHIEDSYISKYFSSISKNTYNIALFHKPDYIEDLLNVDFDLVLSGHNHGGLIRFPFIGSLFSPDLSFLPKYDYGHYSYKEKDAIVTSGLGEHFVKLRVNNKPEICVIDIVNGSN